MNPTETAPNSLDMLKDIHQPEALQQFELAPGWWILIGLFVLIIGYCFKRLYKRYQALKLIAPANAELDQIASSIPNNQSMAELSTLLKRICLIYYPRHEVARLSGNQWLEFLNQQVGKELFTTDHQAVFNQLAYQANAIIDQTIWLEIINHSRIAIKSIIKQAAIKKIKKQRYNQGAN